MTRLKLGAFSDDITRLYRDGNSARSIAKTYNTTTTTVTNFLKKIGLMEHRGRGYIPNSFRSAQKEAINLFNKGVRPVDIFRTTGVSKTIFYQLIKNEGLNLRGLDNYKPTAEQRINAAKGREISGSMNKTEKLVFDALEAEGYEVTPQAFIDGKNADFAIHSHSIAIEVCCRGTFNLYLNDGSLAKRVKQFGKSGFHTYILVSQDFETAATNGIEDMLAWIDFIQRSPTFLREYRVVRSPFDLISVGKIEGDNFSSIISSV